MEKEEDLKSLIKEKYGKIAIKASPIQSSSCCNCCSDNSIDYSIMNEKYDHLEGYVPDADLGLGCGLPTEYSGIKDGDTVLDLGSGAGNDVFIARRIVGNSGEVIGIDMTKEMVERAISNSSKLGYSNVKFILGEIENIPLKSDIIDVVISNCVLNLVPNKLKAFSEIYRVLRSGGHFCISDIVLTKDLPDSIKEATEMYTGCVAGALTLEEYLAIIKKAGFINIEIKKLKDITIPTIILKAYLTDDDFHQFGIDLGIKSITIVGYKN